MSIGFAIRIVMHMSGLNSLGTMGFLAGGQL